MAQARKEHPQAELHYLDPEDKDARHYEARYSKDDPVTYCFGIKYPDVPHDCRILYGPKTKFVNVDGFTKVAAYDYAEYTCWMS